MTRLSMMLLGVIAVASAIALFVTMPRQETLDDVPAPAAPVQKANLAPPAPPVPSPRRLANRPEDPVDPDIDAADLEDGSGS
jgi:hypothetical protein